MQVITTFDTLGVESCTHTGPLVIVNDVYDALVTNQVAGMVRARPAMERASHGTQFSGKCYVNISSRLIKMQLKLNLT